MIKRFIYIGLALVPFAIWPDMDMRIPKEIVGLGLALIIGLVALYNGSLKKFKNYWLLLFISYFLVSMCQAPNFTGFRLGFQHGREITILGTRVMSGFWSFKPLAFALIYLLMMIAIASIDFKVKDVNLIAKVMAWCGFLMALYIFIQAVRLDQFFRIITDAEDPQVKHMTQPLLGGFIGQPTVVAPFIAMLIPIALYLRRYFWAVCMCIAVCLTESKVSIGAMCLSIPLYLIISKRVSFKVIGILLVIGVLSSAVFLYRMNPNKNWVEKIYTSQSSGRVEAWKGMWQDFVTPIEGKKFCVTGFGPGAFTYTHSIRHNNRWWQAHNEPLEALYNFGFIGFGLLLMALWYMTKNVYSAMLRQDELVWSFSSSLICVFICSLGTFPLQGIIAPTMWYTVVIIGLVHNETIIGGEYAEAKNSDGQNRFKVAEGGFD